MITELGFNGYELRIKHGKGWIIFQDGLSRPKCKDVPAWNTTCGRFEYMLVQSPVARLPNMKVLGSRSWCLFPSSIVALNSDMWCLATRVKPQPEAIQCGFALCEGLDVHGSLARYVMMGLEASHCGRGVSHIYVYLYVFICIDYVYRYILLDACVGTYAFIYCTYHFLIFMHMCQYYHNYSYLQTYLHPLVHAQRANWKRLRGICFEASTAILVMRPNHTK